MSAGSKSISEVDGIEAETGILQPELQYMNNYEGQASRMSCFCDITETEDNSIFSSDLEDREEFQANGYFHCDAAQYECYLHDLAEGPEEDTCNLEESGFDQKSNEQVLPAATPEMTYNSAQQAAIMAL